MGKYASEVVKQAHAWLGLNEYDRTHEGIIDIYNAYKPLARGYTVKYNDAWCATFCSAIAIKLRYTSIIPLECSCQKMIEKAIIMGIWQERDNYTPSPGDLILFDWQDSGKGDNKGYSDHIGVVEKISGGKIYTIEGNYSNAVKRRILSLDGRYIRGYICPRYDTEKAPETANKSLQAIAKEVLAGKWGNGAIRKANLENAGYNYADVQKVVNQLANKKPIAAIANEVIKGQWGKGEERKKRLEAAGYNYDAVQKKVNEILMK